MHERAKEILRPLGEYLNRAGVSPNHVSVAGTAFSAIAATAIVAGAPALAGLIYLAAGALDILDGQMARLAGRTTAFGAFLDSTLDRVGEGVVFAAIAYAFAAGGQPTLAALVVIALVGSLLVSYTRARIEGLGGSCNVGMMTRGERVVLVALGLAVGLVPLVIYLLIALTVVTVGQRIFHAYRTLSPPAS